MLCLRKLGIIKYNKKEIYKWIVTLRYEHTEPKFNIPQQFKKVASYTLDIHPHYVNRIVWDIGMSYVFKY